MNDCFIGIDPSFRGLGLSIIDVKNKEIKFKELTVEIGNGTFVDISKASIVMCNKLYSEIGYNPLRDYCIGMEIPPVQGMYAVKLWALDTTIYRMLFDEYCDVWLFNVPYLKFINKKYEGKKDTKEMMDKIIEIFKDYGYTISTNLKAKNGKDRKLTSNQLDSFVYAIRIFVKYSMISATNPEIVSEIININEKFLEEKETRLGKKI